MENQDHGCYEVKLNRFFNIQSTQNIILIAVLLFAYIAYTVVNSINNTTSAQGNVIFLAGDLLIIIVALLSSPKSLDVTPESVKLQYHGALLHFLLTGHIMGGGAYGKNYTLYNIKSIQYLQTPLEKIFSCGHIRIFGDVNLSAKIKEQRTFTVYGVKDFKNTSKWMKEYVNIS